MTKPSGRKTATPAQTPAAALQPSSGDSPDKLGKTQLVARMVELTELSTKEAKAGVDAALDIIVAALRAGQSIGLVGLGTLSVKPTAARASVNPGTGEKIQVPAGRKVSFKVAGDLKQALDLLRKSGLD
jgi:DNA-binding protein HU-beta